MTTTQKKFTDFIETEEPADTGLVQGKVDAKLRDKALDKMKKHNKANPKARHTWNKIIEAGLKMYVAETP